MAHNRESGRARGGATLTDYILPQSSADRSRALREDDVEQAALAWFEALGWRVLHGSYLAPDAAGQPRPDWKSVALTQVLADTIGRLNPHLKTEAVEQVAKRITADASQDPLENNRAFLKLLRDGVDVDVREGSGARTLKARLLDLDKPEANDFLAVHQFTIVGVDERRPDIIAFVNGLPVAVIELKDPTRLQASLKTAFNQLQTYRERIPALFRFNATMIVSDGVDAKIGSLTAGWDRYSPWRTVDGSEVSTALPLETLIRGVFDK
ncbi:MAG: type I restriction endonuclease subunit R, partial [Burkholderiales bacterium]